MSSRMPEPLPPYAFVPGGPWPHPTRSPAGHRFGRHDPPAPPILEDAWELSDAYARGIELFNAGYYWEAHEAWESLWHAHGRRGPTAEVLQALIKLAAAGVKVREGRPAGVRTHASRAATLLEYARPGRRTPSARAGPQAMGRPGTRDRGKPASRRYPGRHARHSRLRFRDRAAARRLIRTSVERKGTIMVRMRPQPCWVSAHHRTGIPFGPRHRSGPGSRSPRGGSATRSRLTTRAWPCGGPGTTAG